MRITLDDLLRSRIWYAGVPNIFPYGYWRALVILRMLLRPLILLQHLNLVLNLVKFGVYIFRCSRNTQEDDQRRQTPRWPSARRELLINWIAPASVGLHRPLHSPSLGGLVSRALVSAFTSSTEMFGRAVQPVWWFAYFVLCDDLEEYEAWYALIQLHDTYFARSMRKRTGGILESRSTAVICLFVDRDQMKISIPMYATNANVVLRPHQNRRLLKTLRMWYRWMQVKRGISEVLLPGKLVRLDIVEAQGETLGKRLGKLDLGRYGTSTVAWLHNPSQVPLRQSSITTQLLSFQKGREPIGIEFVREWNHQAISLIILVPFLLSFVFSIVWIAVFVGRGVDTQVTVQTAFTGASYIVTAGALLIALVAYLDGKGREADSIEDAKDRNPAKLDHALLRDLITLLQATDEMSRVEVPTRTASGPSSPSSKGRTSLGSSSSSLPIPPSSPPQPMSASASVHSSAVHDV